MRSLKLPITGDHAELGVPLPVQGHCPCLSPPVQACWLLGLAGVELAAPKMEEDPNLSCNNIIAATKKLGFAPPG